jgi:predicted short-subunit dehydrogenase-like oxidoreductase (DUF2520 family)
MVDEGKIRAAVVGTGNVATRLCLDGDRQRLEVVHVMGRQTEKTQQLAKLLGCGWATDFLFDDVEAEVLLLCVPDEAIAHVASQLPNRSWLVVHTSASTPLEVLSTCSAQTGILYPLQTFTAKRHVPLKSVPFLIEGSNPEASEKVRLLASCFSENIWNSNAKQRLFVHLSAVFANNFSNHLLRISEQLLHEVDMPLELLHPLMMETVEKAMTFSPADAQTGPARRRDAQTLSKHLSALENHSEWAELYTRLSHLIEQEYPT